MANDNTAKKSILDDIISGSYNPLDPVPSSVPTPLLPAVSSASAPAASTTPTPKGPTLGTEEELAAPAKAAAGPAEGGVWSPDHSTLTLPAPSRQDSAEPLSESKTDQPNFLTKLGRIAGGAIGFEDPRSSPQASLGSRIGQTLGRVGASLALAAGTPEQKQLAEEQLQTPLKTAQLQSEIQYRNGMLGVKDAANQNNANKTNLQYGPEGTSRITAEAAQQNADSNEALRAAHVKQIEASLSGQVHVMPQIAKMIRRPELADQSISPIRYQQEVANVLKSLGAKTVDLGEDGVWGASPLTGKITRLGDSPAVARSNSMLLRTQIPVNDNQGNTLGWVNPQTNSYTPVSAISAKGGGAPLSAAVGGDVIPPKPTSNVMTRGQVAQTILPMVPKIQGEVSQLADKIGPGEGRWNDFWVNKGGVKDADYAGLNQDLQLYATAVAMAHFGASGSQQYIDALMKDFGEAQSPENLSSRIEHAEAWIDGYAKRVGGGNPTPKSSPSAGGGNNVVEYERGTDGKLHPKTAPKGK